MSKPSTIVTPETILPIPFKVGLTIGRTDEVPRGSLQVLYNSFCLSFLQDELHPGKKYESFYKVEDYLLKNLSGNDRFAIQALIPGIISYCPVLSKNEERPKGSVFCVKNFISTPESVFKKLVSLADLSAEELLNKKPNVRAQLKQEQKIQKELLKYYGTQELAYAIFVNVVSFMRLRGNIADDASAKTMISENCHVDMERASELFDLGMERHKSKARMRGISRMLPETGKNI